MDTEKIIEYRKTFRLNTIEITKTTNTPPINIFIIEIYN